MSPVFYSIANKKQLIEVMQIYQLQVIIIITELLQCSLGRSSSQFFQTSSINKKIFKPIQLIQNPPPSITVSGDAATEVPNRALQGGLLNLSPFR